ncbi:6-bladed beta-propeller [Mongoliibacter ruber]|uniref:6-bladed beta-propeller protein n=1 Tax=Mongoliibacter ruber TaxID=1750599 RepID=A0A2T0WLS5_9BACT|nr:6-bladed beta-propeller [Mongoliibacter ruber]PRY87612.1 6-bladed beta-propeller protein [Mongoliibacter ruber]
MVNQFFARAKFFCLIVLLSGYFACSEEPKSDLIQIPVPEKFDDEIYLEDIAKSVERIQLETVEGALLGYIKEVKLLDDKFYVGDSKISVFNREGKFVGRFGNQGSGPGEYGIITSMTLDSEKGLVYIASGKKIMVYNKEGEFLEEKSFRMFVNYVELIKQTPFIMTEEIGIPVDDGFANQTNLIELNSDLDVLDTLPFRTVLLHQVEIGGYPYRHYFSDNGEGVFLYKSVLTSENMIRDTLYRFVDKKFIPYLRLKFERPQSMKESPINDRGYQTLLLHNIMYSANYLIAEYTIEWEKMMFLYDKRSSKGYNLNGGVLDEDGEPLILYPLDLANDIFYFVKSVEYQDATIEEANPVIGVVQLK